MKIIQDNSHLIHDAESRKILRKYLKSCAKKVKRNRLHNTFANNFLRNILLKFGAKEIDGIQEKNITQWIGCQKIIIVRSQIMRIEILNQSKKCTNSRLKIFTSLIGQIRI